ncbi:MAG TPA: hypothetical protein VK116_12245, partial [Planctomycetota bacterium]|nr:hypothetical protein [Planctomycetota bacterium]
TVLRRGGGDGELAPCVIVRATTDRDPLATSTGDPLDFLRYQIRIPATGETLEYRSAASGKTLLPLWEGFDEHFVPRPARGSAYAGRFPRTCGFLGHVLSYRHGGTRESWEEWREVRDLVLDDELLIGTGRNFRDQEGKRLPQSPEPRNYTYAPFTASDYETMIEAGMNFFALVPGIESTLRGEAVFFRRGLTGDAPLDWPVDLYRSNYRGELMFEDEPACIMVNEELVHRELVTFSDAVELLRRRVRARDALHVLSLEKAFRDRGASFGAMRLLHRDYVVWETRFETAWYQLAEGFQGFVHEGRYDLDDYYQSGHSFDAWVKATTGIERRHTAEEMLRFHYAFLRGAARHFDKDWGTSIYGQCDPEIAPLAATLAWDMGARHVWFWTSDHGHHLPWPEQLALAKLLREHATRNPRPSLRGARPEIDRAIVLPYGYFAALESPTGRQNPWDLWWVREMDRAGENEASKRFRARMRRLVEEVHRSFDEKADFDITVDDGTAPRGYRKVIRIED